jgi:enoyl-CoA hydratase/carnithine racemase
MDLLIEKQGKIALFTLNRPEAMNSLSPNLFREMHEAFEDFNRDPELWVGIVTGAGDKAFCAGADVKEWLPFVRESRAKPWLLPTTPLRGMEVTKPLIAAVNGAAMGGGLELVLCCDLRIASEKARFAFPEARLGILPRLGGTTRLPRNLPWCKAAEILFLGKPVDAQEAYRIGLINKAVPPEQVLPSAMEWARELCSVAPLALRSIKEAMTKSRGMSLEEALWIENSLGMALYDTEDYKEGRAAFREKRPPLFKGR